MTEAYSFHWKCFFSISLFFLFLFHSLFYLLMELKAKSDVNDIGLYDKYVWVSGRSNIQWYYNFFLLLLFFICSNSSNVRKIVYVNRACLFTQFYSPLMLLLLQKKIRLLFNVYWIFLVFSKWRVCTHTTWKRDEILEIWHNEFKKKYFLVPLMRF